MPYSPDGCLGNGSAELNRDASADQCRTLWTAEHDPEHYTHHVYGFESQPADYNLRWVGEGKHWHLYRVLGSHVHGEVSLGCWQRKYMNHE